MIYYFCNTHRHTHTHINDTYIHTHVQKIYESLNSDGTVEIVFEFSDIRKFTHLEIWTYGTSLKMTEIFFSIDGKRFALASQISSIQVRCFQFFFI